MSDEKGGMEITRDRERKRDSTNEVILYIKDIERDS